LLSDCRDEILILRRERNKLIEEAAQIVENYETINHHVVTKMRVAARKAAIAQAIRELKE
jgi:vacuolar-type H+-ATPase subunit D/Vma8